MAINKIIPRLISGAQIAAAVKAIYAKVKANFYTRTQSDERYQKKDGSNGTADGVSALMNKLTVGTSDPTDNDYYICQYAGNENISTYHRRKTSSLWNYLKKKMDTQYLGKTGTAEKAKSATYIREDSPRKGSANINFSNDAGLHKFLADAGTTVGKPANDAHIIHCEWDNNQSWAAQLALPANSKAGQRMQYRYQRGQTWTDWESVANVSDLENVPRRFFAVVNDYCINETQSWSGEMRVETIENLRAGDFLCIDFVDSNDDEVYSIEAVLINERAFLLVHPYLGRVFFVTFRPEDRWLENGISGYDITARMLSLD